MYAPGYTITIPPMVSVFTKGIGLAAEDTTPTVPASSAYPTAQRAFYVPLILPAACVIRRVWWANGATTTGGATIEVGVYADSGYGPGAKLISGSAVQGTASQVQFVDVTDTAIGPGLYWIAMLSSSATNTTFVRAALDTLIDATLLFSESSLGSLPTTATPVETANAVLPVCGFATTASP